jgi:type II secretory pathway component PulF
MNFQYTAKSVDGRTLKGSLAAPSLAEARQHIQEKELFVLSVKADCRGGHGSGGGLAFPWTRRIPKRDLLTLTSQLAIMTRAGIDFASALENVSAQCRNPALKAAVTQIYQDVLTGKSASAALGNYAHVFGRGYVASIAAAEKAGRLPHVLERLAALLRSELQMRTTLRTLMAYPLVLMGISGLVIVALMFLVLPQFAGVFEQLDIPLPAVTQLLVALATELRARFWLWGGGLLALMGGVPAILLSKAGRRWVDGVLLNLVLVRDVIRALTIGRVFRLFGTMIESGVPLLEGLRLTRSSIRNCHVRELFDTLEHEVLNGRGLGATFLSTPFVPPGAAQMIATAERTGTLAAVSQLIGTHYEEEGETRLREVTTILEPVIIICMGVIVAFVVMSVMLPVFDFATAARAAG